MSQQLAPIKLSAGQKVYFASDMHLGAPNETASKARERLLIKWLDEVSQDAAAIFLMGDIFDFWYEYKHVIPKGFTRFLGKLAELRDEGIPIIFFTGNHDMWMFDYFPQELGIPIYRTPERVVLGNHQFFLHHGDGLGDHDKFYKVLKKIFNNRICQWLFGWLHPNVGMWIAQSWSQHSRLTHAGEEERFKGADREWLLHYCKEQEANQHHDYYVFGHRHLNLDLEVSETSRYINLGEWVSLYTYGVYDGTQMKLCTYAPAR